jgi:hypothetical protein
MIISDIVCDRHDGANELSARVCPETANGEVFRVWFRFPSEIGSLPNSGDPFLVGFLIPCMFVGEDLHIDAPISPRLFQSVQAIQNLIREWYPGFHLISTTRTERHKRIDTSKYPATGAFFSGGVDSVYTLVKHQTQISELILVHGFENPVQDEELLEVTLRSVLPTVQRFNKKLLVIHTNLRDRTDQWIASLGRKFKGSFFGFCYQGSILAAVGLCLQQKFDRIIIPSSYTYDNLIPYGTHPSLDPLWSTENLDFIHDGCMSSRLEKIKKIMAQASFAAHRLQVCEYNKVGESNCCRCDKCIRTMLAIRLCGDLEQSITFHHPLDLRLVRQMPYPKRWQNDYLELLSESLRLGKSEIAAALKIVLRERLSLYQLWGNLRRLPRRLGARLMLFLTR